MRGLVRWLLMLLVVCVPLKALAATGGFICLHGDDAVAMSMAVPDPAAHEHCEGHDAVATDDAGVAGHACGACAPCCAAAAPAPEALDAGLAELPPDFEPLAVPLASGIVAEVPHRPPR